MTYKPTALTKVLIVVAVVGGGLYGFRELARRGLLPTGGVKQSVVPQAATAPKEMKEAEAAQNVTPIAMPLALPAKVQATRICGSVWEWNAQMGLILANGGAQTSKGSLMEKHGVNLVLRRQDDNSKMTEELVACANQLHRGVTECDCSNGANFVILMTGGSGAFIAGVNPQLKKLGPDYTMRVIGAVGRSWGEDTLMLPPTVKADPTAALGLTVVGVIRDDDWNLGQNWIADNKLKTNPDEKTWDPEAVNWMNTASYNAAAEDFVAGKCENRKVVKNGRLTGETKRVCADGLVTWTPGDVTAAKGKGGLVKIVSTKHYLMPAVILGPKVFFEKNRAEIQHMLAATFEAGDQIKAFDPALRKAAELSARVYGDEGGNDDQGRPYKNGAYWYKYYKGVTEKDKQGLTVELGGSKVYNLADNRALFGLERGQDNKFRSIYAVMSGYAVTQYPELFKDTPLPTAQEIEDRSFITGAEAVMVEPSAVAEVPAYTQTSVEEAKDVVARRSYNFNFDTGKATLTPEGVRQLMDLKNRLASNTLFIKVDGYTDNTGDEAAINLPLSRERALTVKTFLQKQASGDFPDARFKVSGHGSANPVAPNSTTGGRAKNRRVDITLLDARM